MDHVRDDDVGNLRQRVEQNSARLKFFVKAAAPQHPRAELHIAFLGIGAVPYRAGAERRKPQLQAYACQRQRLFREMPATDDGLHEAIGRHFYVRGPALHVSAVMVAAWDFEQQMQGRSKSADAKTPLVPEAFEASRCFGHAILVGEADAAPVGS